MQSECSTERLARFARLQPENALANYYYAVNLWKRRKGPDDAESLAQVESLLKKSVALDSRLGIGYLQLGVLYSERGDFPRAVVSYQQAIKVNPELEEAHYRLAQAYKRTGEKAKAEQELQLYDQISKKKDEAVERERRESRQFVYTLRETGPTAGIRVFNREGRKGTAKDGEGILCAYRFSSRPLRSKIFSEPAQARSSGPRTSGKTSQRPDQPGLQPAARRFSACLFPSRSGCCRIPRPGRGPRPCSEFPAS